ncbi:MAG: DUF5658 family protein [Dehalococcoidales bacterium]|nr:DUF5658 family protein [Dehalococcoidales bacterium]
MSLKLSFYTVIFYVLWMLDAVLTILIVGSGIGAEGNPILREIADSWRLLVAKAAAVPVVFLILQRCPYREKVYGLASVAMGVVVFWACVMILIWGSMR